LPFNIFKVLLETGKAEINLKDENGQTPLDHVSESGEEEMVKLLLEMGKVEVKLDENSRTPTEQAIANQNKWNEISP
jgi:ankyrin repeat protein